MGYTIIVNDIEKYSAQIQLLGDQYRQSLGFLPEGAFLDYIHKKQIYCAVENDQVIAYVMFRVNKRRNCVPLVHVCVVSDKRKTGVAHKLIDTIADKYSYMSHIEVNCRRDYHLEKFWQSCGFIIKSERDGRKQGGSNLTIWQRKLCDNNLLDIIMQEEKKERIFAALDVNVIVQLCDKKESMDQCLLDSKIQDDIKYFVTPECYNEINKKEETYTRRRHFNYASYFSPMEKIQLDDDLVKQITIDIDPNKTHLSDIKHLAYCITSDIIDAFITNDKWIYGQKEYFGTEFNLMVFYPEEFFSYVINADEYNVDKKITGSKYEIKRLDSITITDAYKLFQVVGERKSKWEEELRHYLINRDNYTWLLYDDNGIIGLISVDEKNNYYVIRRLLINMDKNRKIYRFLAMSLLNQPIMYLAQKKTITLLYLASNMSLSYIKPALECGFVSIESGMIKVIAPGAYTKQDLLNNTINYISRVSNSSNEFGNVEVLIKYILQIAKTKEYELEKLLGPTLVVDLQIPTYIISIKPKYAVELFDDNLSYINQSLFDNPHVYAALSMTNAYYTTSSIHFKTPCRILWYITEDKNYAGTGSVRASSIMLYHKQGEPKELYKNYCQLGVLDWEKIKASKSIGLFLFDSTISFNSPLSLNALRRLAASVQRKNIQLQGPLHISYILAKKILENVMEDI